MILKTKSTSDHYDHMNQIKTNPLFLPANRVAISMFDRLAIGQHSATRKHLFLYPQVKSEKAKKDVHQH